MPSLQRAYTQHSGQFDLIAVAVDENLNPAGYFASNNFSFTGGLDVDGANKYRVRSIPFTAFIDRNGNLVSTSSFMSQEQFEAELKKIL